MKKSLLILSAIMMLFVAACKKDKLDEAQAVTQSFQLSYGIESSDLGLPLANAEITLTNRTNGVVLTAKSDAKGLVTFAGVTPGNYSVVANLVISAADYTTITGIYSAQAAAFNASLEANIVTGNSALPMTLKAGRLGNWVIKQIYYGGSSTTSGAIFRDQFIEIYNNSNEVLYADGLYIAQIHGKNARVSSIDVTKPAFLSNGQFNWTKSIGMTAANANNDFVYAKTMFMIPGSGKEYPVQPGASIIIAQNAQNHKAAYVGVDGKEVSVKDPTLTIDLSKADFEAYLGNVAGINPLASDIDNPSVPNVKVLITGGNRDMILNNNGYEGIVLFQTTLDPLKWPNFPDPEATAIVAATDLYTQIPTSLILDAVDIAHTIAASRGPKRVPDALDGGFTFTNGGAYSSQSVIRKTAKTLSARKILKDTNNSTSDFDFLNLADATKTIFK